MTAKRSTDPLEGTQAAKSLSVQAGAFPEIPGYTVTKRLAQGVHEEIYEAIQRSTGDDKVTLKLFLPDGVSRRGEQRFIRELRALASLDHPNIAAAMDIGISPDGRHFLVTKSIAGLSLSKYAMEQTDVRGLLRMFCKICKMVEVAHLRGVVHRDIRPSNVVVDQRGEPHLVNFGMGALRTDRFPDLTIASETEGSGSLPWASPEQMKNDVMETDARTDIYSLGVMLYQIASGGCFPYDVTGSLTDVWKNICTSPPAPLIPSLKARFGRSAIRPGELEVIVFKALSKRKRDRFQSAGEFAKRIEDYLLNKSKRIRLAKPDSFCKRLRARLSLSARTALGRQAKSQKEVGQRYRLPSRWPTVRELQVVYDGLPIRPSLPAWNELTPDRQDWFAEIIVEAALKIPKSAGEVTQSLILDASTIAAIQKVPALLERILGYLKTNSDAPPPPREKSQAGWDDEEELRKIWLRLVVPQRSILKFMRLAGDWILNYKSISVGVALHGIDGDGQERINMSDRTVAKHCKPMEKPPLSLIHRKGDRSSIQLTYKGDRMVKLHSHK